MTPTIARRLMRAGWVQRLAVVIALTTALLVTTVIAMAAFSLSAQQAATRDLGRFDAQVTPSATLRPGASADLTVLSAASSSAVLLTLRTPDLVIATPAHRRAGYLETNWEATPYPGLSLRSGRWPRHPGEIALTGEDAINAGRTGHLSVLAGRVTFVVVGTVTDEFLADNAVLAAPGTWASLPRGAAERASTNLAATASFLSDDHNTPRVQAIARGVGTVTTIRRADVPAESSWIAESPFAFTVPAVLLPAIATALVIGAAVRPSRRFVRGATGVGLTSPMASRSVLLAFTVMALIGGSAGLGAGVLLGAGVRPIVGHFTSSAVGPYPSLVSPVVLIAASTATGVLAGVRLLRPPAGRTDRLQVAAQESSGKRQSHGRRALSLIMVCLAIFLAFRVSDVTSVMIFAVPLGIGWALLVPDVLRGCARLLDNQSPGNRLAARMLRGHLGAASLGTTLTTILLALTLTTVVLLTATGFSARSSALAQVVQGQVGIGSVGGLGEPPPAEVQAIARKVLPGKHFIRVDTVRDAMYSVTQGNFGVNAVPTVSELEQVSGVRITPSQRETLERGGVLVVQPGFTLTINGAPAGARIPVDLYSPAAEWANRSGAIMLTSTAQRNKIALTPGALIAAGVSPEQAERVRQQVSAAGLDSTTVRLYRPPTALLPPTPMIASAILLAVLLLAITYAAGQSQAASLRRQMQRLIAIGAGPGFARRTHLITQTVVTGVGLIAAMAIGGIAIAALLLGNSGVQINPPVTMLVAILAAFVAANLIAIAFATRNLDAAASREA